MQPTIKFRGLFLALFVFTASGYGQAEQTELTPKCETPTVKGEPACWMKAENHDNCYIWNEVVVNEQTVTWSGQCRAGRSDGHGKEIWKYVSDGDTETTVSTGSYVDGKKHGKWVSEMTTDILGFPAHMVVTTPYVNGERHGIEEVVVTDPTDGTDDAFRLCSEYEHDVEIRVHDC